MYLPLAGARLHGFSLRTQTAVGRLKFIERRFQHVARRQPRKLGFHQSFLRFGNIIAQLDRTIIERVFGNFRKQRFDHLPVIFAAGSKNKLYFVSLDRRPVPVKDVSAAF